jgi:hypothetical protein
VIRRGRRSDIIDVVVVGRHAAAQWKAAAEIPSDRPNENALAARPEHAILMDNGVGGTPSSWAGLWYPELDLEFRDTLAHRFPLRAQGDPGALNGRRVAPSPTPTLPPTTLTSRSFMAFLDAPAFSPNFVTSGAISSRRFAVNPFHSHPFAEPDGRSSWPELCASSSGTRFPRRGDQIAAVSRTRRVQVLWLLSRPDVLRERTRRNARHGHPRSNCDRIPVGAVLAAAVVTARA